MTKKSIPSEGEEVVILSPSIIKVKGKLFYSEGAQSWNILRLKREILHEYPQLKQKSESFGYTMIIPKSREGFEELIKSDDKEALPILLFFNKTPKEE